MSKKKYNYNDSQSIYEGQKQHPKETKLIFSIRKKDGWEPSQLIHVMKFNAYCNEYNLSIEAGAKLLECTPGVCYDIRNFNRPLTTQMELNFEKNTGIRITTLRLDDLSKHLKKSRTIKFDEIFTNFRYAIYDSKYRIVQKRPLIKNFGNPRLGRVSHPLLGVCLKCWRAANGDSQYSLADKICIHHQDMIVENLFVPSWAKRVFWKNVENDNRVSAQGNSAFYRTFGISVLQACAPFIEYLSQNNINPNDSQNVIKSITMLNNIDKSAKISTLV